MITQLKYNLLVVLGPTASGKTSFAAHLATITGSEIISADSRQVYRGMDIGTGKDLDDYMVEGKEIPYHLIDIVEAGYKYNVFEYQQDFFKIFSEIMSRGVLPLMCGGSGMYIEAVIEKYRLISVPENPILREELKLFSDQDLSERLKDMRTTHNTSDFENRKRLIRAIEIAAYYKSHPQKDLDFPQINPCIIGIRYDRATERSRITSRLKDRLEHGMLDEVSRLSKKVDVATLEFYGLEYKYLSWYLSGKISYEEMFGSLNTAIHQFAKRQMTWFRRMEKKGHKIHWIDGELSMTDKLQKTTKILSEE